MPAASPIMGDMPCPLGPGPETTPHITTPLPVSAGMRLADDPPQRPSQRQSAMLGGLAEVDSWAWEMGSEVGSVNSAWSKSTAQSAARSSASSRLDGDQLIPGLIEGQRLHSLKPLLLSAGSGGKLIVGLKKQVPQGYWDHLEIVLVSGPTQVKLKPIGIKKGKKLCVEVPGSLTPGDYDVRLVFAQKMLHGAMTLEVCDGDVDPEEAMDDDFSPIAPARG